MSPPPAFASDRLRMRPVMPEDAPALHVLYADAAAMRWWSHAPHTSEQQTRDKVAQLAAGSPGWTSWAVADARDDRTAIGTLSAFEKRPGAVFEIGYALVPARHGLGLAREAVSALLDQLFGTVGARRVFADTDPDNAASNRLLNGLGFRQEGRLRAEWETHIGVRDSLIWGLLAQEWRR